MSHQLNDGPVEGPREVMNETYDKTIPVHDPERKPDEPVEVFPYRTDRGDKDFRPINQINYADTVEEVDADDEEEVDPKDSSAPESVPSSTSEPTTVSESPASPEKTVSAEKDSGLVKEPESGSPTSSLPPMIGDVGLPASVQPQGEESQIPGSPAKQN